MTSRIISFIAVVGALGFAVPAGALELRYEGSVSEADANFCGDLNSIVTFTARFSEADLTGMGDSRWFQLSRRNYRVLADAIRAHFPLGDELEHLIVKDQYEPALDHLIRDLGLTYDRDGKPYLSSCYEFSVLKDFGLRISRSGKRLVRDRRKKSFSFLTYGALRQDWNAAEYSFNTVVDIDGGKIHVFLLW